jgi:hypothetical protein
VSSSDDFVKSTPKQAREIIGVLRDRSWLTAADRAILDRLASDVIMEVAWAKLPTKEGLSSERVVLYAFDAARWALAQRPPFWKMNKAAQEKYIEETKKRGPDYDLENVATLASMLREAMIATRKLMQPLDPSSLKFDELLSNVDDIERAYRRMYAQQVQDWKQFQCPRIRTVSAKNAAEVRFSKMMSRYFQRELGKPLDAVVAALTQAVFGKITSEETARKRRRPP